VTPSAREHGADRLKPVPPGGTAAAVGDALGLPREGLSAAQARRLFGDEIRHCLLLGRGMVSDDTDHAVMTAQALLACPDDADRFARDLAWRLRWWFLALPAGVGLATLRACLRLWVGVPPGRSGVWSVGNGPMMRAPVIGVCFAHDVPRMRTFVRASTRLTHTDPRAESAALAVALAASWRLRQGPAEPRLDLLATEIRALVAPEDEELNGVLERAGGRRSLDGQWSRGPSGYCYDTLLAVLHTWAHHGDDYAVALRTVIGLGGDADTTGAILGGIVGANLGAGSVPEVWREGVWAWPRGMAWMERLGQRLAGVPVGSLRYCGPGIALRNLVFLAAVLVHAFRRLLFGGRR
jgi:ADP-ribosyl-[dinitrogen reductase] hydrolase